MLIGYLRTVMVNKENYYKKYNDHTKWLSLISSHFTKNYYLFHDNAQYIYIGCEKFLKTLVQVHFPVYALSKHKQNPSLKANGEKNG